MGRDPVPGHESKMVGHQFFLILSLQGWFRHIYIKRNAFIGYRPIYGPHSESRSGCRHILSWRTSGRPTIIVAYILLQVDGLSKHRPTFESDSSYSVESAQTVPKTSAISRIGLNGLVVRSSQPTCTRTKNGKMSNAFCYETHDLFV